MTEVRTDAPITVIRFDDGSQDWFFKWINVITDTPRFCKANGWDALDANGQPEEHREQVELTFKPYQDKDGKEYTAIDCKRRVTGDRVFTSNIPKDHPLDNHLVTSDTYFAGFWGKMHLFYGVDTESRQWNISRRYSPFPNDQTPWDMWKGIVGVLADANTPTTIRMWGEDRDDNDKYADDVTHYTVICMEFTTGNTATVVRYAPAKDDGRLYDTFSAGWKQHQATVHKPTGPDFAHTFPPDDGSGDWFYFAISAAIDTPRRATVDNFVPVEGTEGQPGVRVQLGRVFTPYDGTSAYLCVSLDMPDNQEILRAYSPWALMLPTDGTDEYLELHRHEGDGVWADAYRKVLIHQRFDSPYKERYNPCRNFDDTVATLSIVAINYYYQGITLADRQGKPSGKFNWSSLCDDRTRPYAMKFKPGRGESAVNGIMFHLLGNYPDKYTVVFFEGAGTVKPEEGYTPLRTRVFQMPAADYLAAMYKKNDSGSYSPLLAAQTMNYYLEGIGLAPLVDFTYQPYPVTETFATAFKRELDKAGLNYASPTSP